MKKRELQKNGAESIGQRFFTRKAPFESCAAVQATIGIRRKREA